ncbi:hypothetical protein FJT64_000859 [Amphibalanus amphitrite]|uniref:Uncharacterized protein n=1 Tax=Amphibalanus amphitrite TaxID=1232801 RepID=A0A6A4VHQ8_AMPAM|nr:hypothetical protein FJT64_000859 [Amphibalanus amphitrite]
MLRVAILCCLTAAAVATFVRRSPVGGSIYDVSLVRPSVSVLRPAVTVSPLQGVLLPGDVVPAVSLIRTRYGRLSRPAAIDIIRIILERPHVRLLRAVQLRQVPTIGRRLGFLRTLLGALPPVFYSDGYTSGLLAYLQQLGVSASAGALREPLALVDARLACSLLTPVSVPTFLDFFGSRVLRLGGGASLRGLPPLQTFYSRLVDLRLTPVPLGFQRIVLRTGRAGLSVNPLAPALSQLGLTGLVRPNIIYGGLETYLSQQGLPVSRFVRGLSQLRIPSLPSLTEQVAVGPLLPRLQFLPVRVIRRDVVPLLVVRFYTLPRRLIRVLDLSELITGYLSTLQFTERVTLRPQYIVTLLTGFDEYIHSRAKGFRGRLWCRGIWGEW